MALCTMAVNTVECEDIRYPADAVINLAKRHTTWTPADEPLSGAQSSSRNKPLMTTPGTSRPDSSAFSWDLPHGWRCCPQYARRDVQGLTDEGLFYRARVVTALSSSSIMRRGLYRCTQPNGFYRFQSKPGQRRAVCGLHTNIFNLTIDVGARNLAPLGSFFANNAGGLRDVRIRSSDRSHVGATGLLLSTIPGPQPEARRYRWIRLGHAQ